MSKAIGLDKERERELAAAKAAEAAEMEMAVAADKSALQGEQTRWKSGQTQVGVGGVILGTLIITIYQPASCSHTTCFFSVPSLGEDEEEADEDDLLTADEYWREYLNEMARKKVIEKLVMRASSVFIANS